MQRRHKKASQILMHTYLEQRRDELIEIWGDTRDRHPQYKVEIDAMFGQLLGELEQAIATFDGMIE